MRHYGWSVWRRDESVLRDCAQAYVRGGRAGVATVQADRSSRSHGKDEARSRIAGVPVDTIPTGRGSDQSHDRKGVFFASPLERKAAAKLDLAAGRAGQGADAFAEIGVADAGIRGSGSEGVQRVVCLHPQL